MTKIKLTDNLSLSQIIRGFWRLDTWELSTDELIDNMKSSIDLGVTSFDTAEIYADTLCESQIGEAFAKDPALRGKVELISKTGIYKQEIIKSVKIAKENGAKIIAITENENSTLAIVSDINLNYVSSETLLESGAVSSKIAQIFIVDLIYTQVVKEMQIDAVSRKIKTTEAIYK